MTREEEEEEDVVLTPVLIPRSHRTGVKSEGEWGGADVDGGLLDDLDVDSPVQNRAVDSYVQNVTV